MATLRRAMGSLSEAPIHVQDSRVVSHSLSSGPLGPLWAEEVGEHDVDVEVRFSCGPPKS